MKKSSTWSAISTCPMLATDHQSDTSTQPGGGPGWLALAMIVFLLGRVFRAQASLCVGGGNPRPE